MRKWTALLLRRIADYVAVDEHIQLIEACDEYDICRCTVEIRSDGRGHGIANIGDRLPLGWAWHAFEDDERWP